jgi:ribonuclease Z
MVDPQEVLGPPEGRKKLIIVGDAETTNGLAEHARDADVLVIEGSFSNAMQPSHVTMDISPRG